MSLFSSLLGNAGAISKEQLQEKYHKLLIPSENIEAGFQLIRDTFIFTNKCMSWHLKSSLGSCSIILT